MMSRHGFDLPWERELDLGIVELLDGSTTAVLGRHFLNLDDLEKKNGIMKCMSVTLSHRLNTIYLVFIILAATSYLDRGGSSSVSSSHVSVALSDSASGSEIAVFAIHVVRAGTRVIAQPDTQVLDGRWLLLVDLLTINDLTVSLLDLLREKMDENLDKH